MFEHEGTVSTGLHGVVRGDTDEWARMSGRGFWRRTKDSVVARNTVIQVANQGLSIGTGLVTFAMSTRALGADAYGAFGLATTYAAFVAIILDAGLDTHIVNDLAVAGEASPRSAKAHRLVSEAAVLRCGLWLVATGGAMAIGALGEYEPLVMVGVALLSVSALVGAVGMLVADVYQAALDVRIAVLGSFLTRMASVGLISGLYLVHLLSVESLLIVTLISGVAGFGAVLAIAMHQGFAFQRVSVRGSLRLYSATASLAIWVILGQVVYRADVVVLSLVRLHPSLGLTNQRAVGIYVAAYKFFDLSIGLPQFIVISLMPRLARFAASDLGAYSAYLRRWLVRMGAMGTSVGLAFAAIGGSALGLIAGPSFARSEPIVAILAGAMPFAFLTSLLFAAIVAIGARMRLVVFYLAVALFNVGANIILTPEWGYWAAAWLTTLCQAILAIGMAAILWRAMERTS